MRAQKHTAPTAAAWRKQKSTPAGVALLGAHCGASCGALPDTSVRGAAEASRLRRHGGGAAAAAVVERLTAAHTKRARDRRSLMRAGPAVGDEPDRTPRPQKMILAGSRSWLSCELVLAGLKSAALSMPDPGGIVTARGAIPLRENGVRRLRLGCDCALGASLP